MQFVGPCLIYLGWKIVYVYVTEKQKFFFKFGFVPIWNNSLKKKKTINPEEELFFFFKFNFQVISKILRGTKIKCSL